MRISQSDENRSTHLSVSVRRGRGLSGPLGGRQLNGPYRFCSLTIKGLERRLDAIFEPEGHGGPVFLIEFQGQALPTAWYNLLAKMGLYGEEHPESDVFGIGVFLREADAPRRPSWAADTTGPPTQGERI